MRFYNLVFSVGGVQCRLESIVPEIPHTGKYTKYYEHYHSCFELHFLYAGNCVYLCQKKLLTLTAGEIILIPPRIYHRDHSASEDSKKMSLSFYVEIEKTNDGYDKHFCEAFSLDAPRIIKPGSSAKERLLSIKRLATECEGFLNREKMRAEFNAFIIELFEILSSDPTGIIPQKSAVASQENIIDTFFALEFMSNSSCKLLSQKLHLSTRQLTRVIRKKYGMNYREKLKEIRIEIATNFLRCTDKSIREISELLGYSSPENFSTFIKSATGRTPSEIRRSSL